MRIPKEIVLIPESARAEFLADHERVPEKNRGLESVLEGAQRGTFRARNGAPVGKPPRPSSARHFEPQTSTVSILRYNS